MDQPKGKSNKDQENPEKPDKGRNEIRPPEGKPHKTEPYKPVEVRRRDIVRLPGNEKPVRKQE